MKTNLIIFKNNDFNLSRESYGYEEVDGARVYDENVHVVIDDYPATEDMQNYPEAFVLNAEKNGLQLSSNQSLLDAKAKHEREEKSFLMSQAVEIADQQHQAAKKRVYGEKNTPEQLERYREKYRRAKAGEFEDSKNQTIINKHEQARTTIAQHTDNIETWREELHDLIKAGNITEAREAIKAKQSE